jgi:integrase/recombinase XerD
MPSIETLLNSFAVYLKDERQLAATTQVNYVSDLKQLGEWLHGKDVSVVTIDDLRQYKRHLSQRVKYRTIERKFACLATFWRWLKMERHVSEVITDYIIIEKKPRPLPNPISEIDLLRFLTTPDPARRKADRDRNELAWQLLGWLALRRSEVLNLKVGDVDLEQGWITIRKSKGQRERVLPIPAPELHQRLAAAMFGRSTDSYVCTGWTGRWRPKAFHQSFKHHCKACGLPAYVSPRTIRTSVATMLKRRGADIFELKELLGHADIKTTTVYLLLDQKVLRSTLTRHIANRK